MEPSLKGKARLRRGMARHPQSTHNLIKRKLDNTEQNKPKLDKKLNLTKQNKTGQDKTQHYKTTQSRETTHKTHI